MVPKIVMLRCLLPPSTWCKPRIESGMEKIDPHSMYAWDAGHQTKDNAGADAGANRADRADAGADRANRADRAGVDADADADTDTDADGGGLPPIHQADGGSSSSSVPPAVVQTLGW